MKLLFDQNLSRHLGAALADKFPGAVHTSQVGLDRAPGLVIWEYAAANGHMLVTKDADFHPLSLVRGAPPKVVWIRTGNASTAQITALPRDHMSDLKAFPPSPMRCFWRWGRPSGEQPGAASTQAGRCPSNTTRSSNSSGRSPSNPACGTLRYRHS